VRESKRSGGHRDPEFLMYWYWDMEYSQYDIGEMCNISATSIRRWMKRLSIPSRSQLKSARTQRKRKKVSIGLKRFCENGGKLTSSQYKHGGACHGKEERLYLTWCRMRERCYNTRRKDYKYYSAKNIQLCDEWFDDYAVFRDWATQNGYQDKLSIHRKDSDNNYKPSNCEWLTKSEHSKKSAEGRVRGGHEQQ